MERIAVIIVAGGSGRRCGGPRPKQFALLGGMPVLARTIGRFAEALPGAEIVVVLPAEHIAFWRDLAARFEVAPHTVTEGGAERFHSVRRGLAALRSTPELVAVHDGVRPLASVELIRRVAAAAAEHGAALPAVEPVDSFRETDGVSSRAVDRRRLRIVQTPQVFRTELLRAAYAAEYRPEFTDDASVVEAAGHAVFLCAGEPFNLKITRPEDLLIAETLLAAQEERPEEPGAPADDRSGTAGTTGAEREDTTTMGPTAGDATPVADPHAGTDTNGRPTAQTASADRSGEMSRPGACVTDGGWQ